MFAILDADCSVREKAAVVRMLESLGLGVHVSEADVCAVSVLGPSSAEVEQRLERMPGVREIRRDGPAYPLVARAMAGESSRIKVNDLVVGGDDVVVIAGPCSVESAEQLSAIALAVAAAGAGALRGGAFKPRTSPYSFQGLGEEGLRLLADARERTGLRVVSEVMAPEDVDLVGRYADVLQVGGRNMQNFRLLSAVGSQSRPVLLKRGMSSTLDELLLAAEYIVSGGNPGVILCERGIRTFETSTRNTLDISAVPVLKERTHLPVIVDPSHAAGRRELVPALARAAIAAGADGLLVEVHHTPDLALTDGRQSLTLSGFAQLMQELDRVCGAVGRMLRPVGDSRTARPPVPATVSTHTHAGQR